MGARASAVRELCLQSDRASNAVRAQVNLLGAASSDGVEVNFRWSRDFQVEVNFDYAVLGATGATAADWPALTSTLNVFRSSFDLYRV